MTNKELVDLNQVNWASHPVLKLPSGFEQIRVWEGNREAFANPPEFIALFNLDDKPSTLHFKWSDLVDLKRPNSAQDLFSATKVDAQAPMTIVLPPHGSVVYRIQ
jgi:hypothetical protein